MKVIRLAHVQTGKINNTKGKETLKCYSCDFYVDRDVEGSRNILIKNVILN